LIQIKPGENPAPDRDRDRIPPVLIDLDQTPSQVGAD
jgi:hypothetical protein